MAGQPAEHPSERPKSNRFSVSLFASVVLGAANDVLKLVTSLACFIFRFLRRPLAGRGVGHRIMDLGSRVNARCASPILPRFPAYPHPQGVMDKPRLSPALLSSLRCGIRAGRFLSQRR